MIRVPHRATVVRDLRLPSHEAVVELAGRHAHAQSLEPDLRRLAADLTQGLLRVDLRGAQAIARWIRGYIRYRQETPGVEVLQGAYTTLKHRVGDCDDLVLLWMALCRSVGIDATFVGVRRRGSTGFVHAVGYVPSLRMYYELTDDRRYGGRRAAIEQTTLPAGCEGLYWSPDDERLHLAVGGGPGWSNRAMSCVDVPLFPVVAIGVVAAVVLWRA